MKQTLDLNGKWQLFYTPNNSSLTPLPPASLKPIPAQVPGNVELDLQRAGQIPDPFYALNIHSLRPLEICTWWYQRTFSIPTEAKGTSWELVFHGLDTFAEVWLNNTCLGRSENMLVEQRFDATYALRFGEENLLTVRLDPAYLAARRFSYDASAMSWEHREEGLFIRKASHVWGWDIMPRAVSAGIWKPVFLQAVPECAIEHVYYWTRKLTSKGAELGVSFQIRVPDALVDGYSLQFHGECDNHTFDFTWPLEFIAGHCEIPIPDARLWWPQGYGKANLYTIRLQVRRGDDILAERVERVGIRKLVLSRTHTAGQSVTSEPLAESPQRLDQPPDPASHFLFYVNDQPIMIKGSNWVPLDAFHSRDIERVEQAIHMADDLGCNMLRCWGGNVYESDRFFDLCDEKGILVWQDFAFACCRYPQTTKFLDQVHNEVKSVIIRLRNHASLAVWCGDNEIDMAYLSDGLSPQFNRLTREVIPHVLQRLDPQRPYVPSSPYVPPDVETKYDAWRHTPEQHLWGPRGYFKAPFYLQHSAHFIGEIGYHGCPAADSIRKFISPERLWPWQDNPEWHAHDVFHWQHKTRDRDRIRLMANQVKELFGAIPEDLETFIIASQITQAEAVKYFIESTRQRKWHTSGILWWNIIDGWPQFSDAVVDYYGVKKLAYHYIRRVQRPVMVMAGEAGSGKYLPIIACNDTLQTVDVHYHIWDASDQRTLLEGSQQLPPNQNWQVGTVRTYASDQKLLLIEWQIAGKRFGNHYLAGRPPISLESYRTWLTQIAALPDAFKL